ncbi:ABC transporter permease [Saccharopolyspora pogona]|uniref:ABC transporter permease n=1 Tax=Saccharopolyspora pogona TaxID=333966 RepID=UPI00168871F1|nr:ABC transporter permease [Saccharopolyspora pogona]
MSTITETSAPQTRTGDTTRPGISGRWLKLIDLFMPIAAVALIVYFGVATQSFLTTANFTAMLTQNATTFIVAVVAALLLMAGYVDLSVGSVMAVSAVAAGLTFNGAGFVPGIVVGLLVGLLCGLANGVLIGWMGLSPIVVTLGMLAAARGVAQFLAPDSLYGFPPQVSEFGSGSFLGVSYLGWTAIVVAVCALVVLNWLPLGRRIVAIGVNPRAAYLVGIRVKPIVIGLYVVLGLLVGLSGILQGARLDSVPSGTLGVGFEVTVLTAILVGGVPFTGGPGSVLRVLLGVVIIAILRNGLTLLNYGPDTAGIFTGAVLVAAAGLETVRYWIKQKL